MSLVMSEEQDLALTVWGTVVALGAEVTCTFEGKSISCLSLSPLCHDAPLVVGAHSISGGFSPWMSEQMWQAPHPGLCCCMDPYQ